MAVRKLQLLSFFDVKDYLLKHRLRFERYSNVNKWKKQTWIVQFSPLFQDKLVKIYNRSSSEKTMEKAPWNLQVALLVRYNVTERGHGEKFCGTKPGNSDVQLKSCLD